MRFNLSPIGIFELGKETLNRKEFIQRYQWLVVVIATDCLTFSSDSWVFIYEKVEDMFFFNDMTYFKSRRNKGATVQIINWNSVKFLFILRASNCPWTLLKKGLIGKQALKPEPARSCTSEKDACWNAKSGGHNEKIDKQTFRMKNTSWFLKVEMKGAKYLLTNEILKPNSL